MWAEYDNRKSAADAKRGTAEQVSVERDQRSSGEGHISRGGATTPGRYNTGRRAGPSSQEVHKSTGESSNGSKQ